MAYDGGVIVPGHGWEVRLHVAVAHWLDDLRQADPKSAHLVMQALDVLAMAGPMQVRPLVDRIKGSRYHNLKELRPASAGRTEIRILFVFDPLRRAIVLVAGDKSGNWRSWYDRNIPLAEKRSAEHLEALEGETR